MHTFQINVLIQILVSATCSEHLVFNIRKAVRIGSLCMVFFFMHLCT